MGPVLKRRKCLVLLGSDYNEYLSEIVPVYRPPLWLRSCSQSLFCLPSSENTNRKRFEARAFKNAVPKLWNPLDDALKRVETPAVFKKNLKTFLFTSDE